MAKTQTPGERRAILRKVVAKPEPEIDNFQSAIKSVLVGCSIVTASRHFKVCPRKLEKAVENLHYEI